MIKLEYNTFHLRVWIIVIVLSEIYVWVIVLYAYDIRYIKQHTKLNSVTPLINFIINIFNIGCSYVHLTHLNKDIY